VNNIYRSLCQLQKELQKSKLQWAFINLLSFQAGIRTAHVIFHEFEVSQHFL